ncbi:hypothetical protein CAY59_26790 (plasmid) [Vibrio campbellii]|uniref:type II secretion system protein n=1 Tax=Vibrio campbellii TaxID=680 RepID=UPI000A2FF002|nr:hypothetical protein [Vibrio campbellii]ARR47839.1 hypothetical protein CAY59_26790 [Vibrio campbellii]
MKPYLTQRGFGLVETVITLALIMTIVGISLPFLLEQRKDDGANAYANHVRVLIERIHQYQYFKITEEGVNPSSKESWPATLESLMTDYPLQYWNSCSAAEEQNGDCVQPDFVPWSRSRIASYFQTDASNPAFNTHLVLRFPLSELASEPKDYTRWSNVLMDIPGAQRVGNDIDITLRQATLALMYDNIVMRDGYTTLTDDWDVGGEHAISHVRDITIRNSDGSVTSVSQGLINMHTVQPWGEVPKPSCPEGLAPKVTLAIGEVDVEYPYTLTGSIRPYVYDEDANNWTVNIDAYVVNVEANTYQRLSQGEIIAMTQCTQ